MSPFIKIQVEGVRNLWMLTYGEDDRISRYNMLRPINRFNVQFSILVKLKGFHFKALDAGDLTIFAQNLCERF